MNAFFDQLLAPEAWMGQALCAQTDPELFFPEKGGSTKQTKRICNACPVQAACLERALQNKETFGVWGGHSALERYRLVRNPARAAAVLEEMRKAAA